MFFARRDSPKFIVTGELGRLARWLRILGFDCVFFDRQKKKDIVIESLRENRIILTRETRLARFSGVRSAKPSEASPPGDPRKGMLHIESDIVEEQLRQAVRSLRLKVTKENMFTRCVECNGGLERIEKERIKDKIPPYVYKAQNEFMYCVKCDKAYWRGTHFQLAGRFLEKVKLC